MTRASGVWLSRGFAVACLGLLAGGALAVREILSGGLAVTGLNRPAFWGLMESSFLFLAGLGTSATFLGALMRLTGRGPLRAGMRAVARRADAVAVACLAGASAGLMLHLGRPWLFYRVILNATPSSPLFWDMCFVTACGLLSALSLLGVGRTGSGLLERCAAVGAAAIYAAAHSIVWWRHPPVPALPGGSTLFGPWIAPGAIAAAACAVVLASASAWKGTRPVFLARAGAAVALAMLFVERWRGLSARLTQPPMAYNAGSYTPGQDEWMIVAAEAAAAILAARALIWWDGRRDRPAVNGRTAHRQETSHALIP